MNMHSNGEQVQNIKKKLLKSRIMLVPIDLGIFGKINSWFNLFRSLSLTRKWQAFKNFLWVVWMFEISESHQLSGRHERESIEERNLSNWGMSNKKILIYFVFYFAINDQGIWTCIMSSHNGNHTHSVEIQLQHLKYIALWHLCGTHRCFLARLLAAWNFASQTQRCASSMQHRIFASAASQAHWIFIPIKIESTPLKSIKWLKIL